MVVSGVLVVLLCIDEPKNILWAVAGVVTGCVAAAIVNKRRGK